VGVGVSMCCGTVCGCVCVEMRFVLSSSLSSCVFFLLLLRLLLLLLLLSFFCSHPGILGPPVTKKCKLFVLGLNRLYSHFVHSTVKRGMILKRSFCPFFFLFS